MKFKSEIYKKIEIDIDEFDMSIEHHSTISIHLSRLPAMVHKASTCCYKVVDNDIRFYTKELIQGKVCTYAYIPQFRML